MPGGARVSSARGTRSTSRSIWTKSGARCAASAAARRGRAPRAKRSRVQASNNRSASDELAVRRSQPLSSRQMTVGNDHATSSRTLLVLVVEDDPEARHFYTDVLTRDGFATDEAHNGHQALAKALELTPDLILTDIA